MLLDGDGHDHYGGNIANMLNGIVAQYGTGVSLVDTKSRTGTHSMKFTTPGTFNGSHLFMRRAIPAGTRPAVGVAFAIWFDALPTASDKIGCSFLDTDSNVVGQFTYNADGRVRVWRGAKAALLGESALPVLNAHAWNFVEFKMARSATVGSTGMRVNMNEVDGLMLDNVNTAGTANDYTQFRLGTIPNLGDVELGTTFGYSYDHYIDDYLVWDSLGDDNNDWIGDQELLWRVPIADHPTLPQEFVPSTGTDLWPLVDEANPSAVDYISALVADKQAAFDFDDLPSDITDIVGIIPYIFAKKLNAGPCNVNVGMLTNDIVGDAKYQAIGPDIAITTVDTFWRGVLERNPDTNLPYTPAEVNGSYLYLDRTL